MATRRKLGALTTAGMLLAACGGVDATPPDTRREPVPLSYWKSLGGPRHEAQVRLVEAFHAAQEDVRVTVEHAGEYGPAAEKLRLTLAAGTPPDVAMIGVNAELPSFARAGALTPLEPLGRGGAGDLDGFYSGFLRDGSVDGRLYQLPLARSVPLLYVNRDALTRHGLPETAPETWIALRETAARVARVAGDPGTALGLGTSWWDCQAVLWSFGGGYSGARRETRIDAPESVAALRFLADLVHREGAAVATKRAQVEFLEGGRAMYLGSSATLMEALHSRIFRAGVGQAPLGPGGQRAVPGGGGGLSIPTGRPRRQLEGAWRFIRFMTDAPQTAFFARSTGYLPVRPAATDLRELTDLYAQFPAARVAVEQLAHVRPNDSVIGVPGVTRSIEEALERLLFGGESPQIVSASLAAALRGLVETTPL